VFGNLDYPLLSGVPIPLFTCILIILNISYEYNIMENKKISKKGTGISSNKLTIMESIFNIEDTYVLDLTEKKEPNWSFMFFDWLTESMKEIYQELIHKLYNSANLTFINGLISELGYFGTEINYPLALSYYIEGARLHNQYSFFKLFYIFKDHYKVFNVEQDIDLAIFFLIKAACYNESFLDLNRIDPLQKLSMVITYADKDLTKSEQLLTRMKSYTNIEGLCISDLEYSYIFRYLSLSFSSRVVDFKKALLSLEALAESRLHPEACYKLACLYYNPINTDICTRNVSKSIEIFNYLVEIGYSKVYCSFYKVCEEQKDLEKAEQLLLLSKKAKHFSAQFYANFLSRQRDEIIPNSAKIFKHFFRSFLYGNLISVVICFEIITQITVKQRNNIIFDNEYYLGVIFEFVKSARRNEKFYQILDYDVVILFFQIYAFYYYKGLLVEKDYNKAVKILTEPFEHEKSVKNYRKVFYYLSKIYRKLGMAEQYEFYLKKTFDIYILLKEFPYHHYLVGKVLFRGSKFIKRNLEDAYFFFNMGASYKENFFFINSFYSKKCADFLHNHREVFAGVQLPTKIDYSKYTNEDEICHICCANVRQVIYKTCGHEYICLICFDKMNKNEKVYKCPMCKQESDGIINTFPSYLQIPQQC
jgi:TPR repeat protein